jgi:hypothetical protein
MNTKPEFSNNLKNENENKKIKVNQNILNIIRKKSHSPEFDKGGKG